MANGHIHRSLGQSEATPQEVWCAGETSLKGLVTQTIRR